MKKSNRGILSATSANSDTTVGAPVAVVSSDPAAVPVSESSEKLLPVIDIFGPTVQGEGIQIGQRTLFARFGYCDYRCSWCDSLHAVTPALVKAKAEWLTATETAFRLYSLGHATATNWVTLSGGNPAMHNLSRLVNILHYRDMYIAVETQGTLAPAWLADCDLVVVSPKPPSSGMDTDLQQLSALLNAFRVAKTPHILKVVVFNGKDFAYARNIRLLYPFVKMYLSVGNVQLANYEPHSAEDNSHRIGLLDDLRILTEMALKDPVFRDVIVTPQLHVLMWGNKVGV